MILFSRASHKAARDMEKSCYFFQHPHKFLSKSYSLIGDFEYEKEILDIDNTDISEYLYFNKIQILKCNTIDSVKYIPCQDWLHVICRIMFSRLG